MIPDNVKKQIELIVKAELGDSLSNFEKLEKQIQKIISQNPALVKNSQDLAKEVKKLSNEYASAAGASTISFASSFKAAVDYNNQLNLLTISSRKYGNSIEQTTKLIKRVSDETGLARQEVISFIKNFERNFNFAGLENGEKLLKNIQNVVGSDIQAINQMSQSVAQLAQQFPDLEQSLTRMNDQDRNKLQNLNQQLAMTGQISMAQYKSNKELFDGNAKLSIEERKRQKELQEGQKSIEEMKKAFSDLSIEVGSKLVPVLSEIASLLKAMPVLVAAISFAPMIGQAGTLLSKLASMSQMGGLAGKTRGIGGLIGKVGGKIGGLGGSIGTSTIGLGKGILAKIGLGAASSAAGSGAAGAAGATTAGAGVATTGLGLAVGGAALAGIAALATGTINAIYSEKVDQAIKESKKYGMGKSYVGRGFDRLELGLGKMWSDIGIGGGNYERLMNVIEESEQIKNQVGEFDASKRQKDLNAVRNKAFSSLRSGGYNQALNMKSNLQSDLERFDKENRFNERYAAYEKLDNAFTSSGDYTEERKAELAKSGLSESQIEKQRQSELNQKMNMEQSINRLLQQRSKITTELDAIDTSIVARQILYRDRIEASNQLLNNQQQLISASLTKIGALGSASIVDKENLSKIGDSMLQTLSVQDNAATEFLKMQKSQEEKAQSDRQKRITELNQKINEAQGTERDELVRQRTEDMEQLLASEMKIKSVETQLAAQQSELANKYAEASAQLVRYNEAQKERLKVLATAVSSRSNLQQYSGDVLGATRTQAEIANVYQEQRRQNEAQINSVRERIDLEKNALQNELDPGKRQAREAAIIRLQKEGNQLITERREIYMQELEALKQIASVADKRVSQLKAYQDYLSSIKNLVSAGGNIAAGIGLGRAEASSIAAQRNQQQQLTESLEIAVKQAEFSKQRASNQEEYNMALARENELKAKLAENQKAITDLTMAELEARKNIQNAAQPLLTYQNTITSQMEAQIELMGALGVGLAASADQRLKVAMQLDNERLIVQEKMKALDLATKDVQQDLLSGKISQQDAEANLLQLATERRQRELEVLQINIKQANMTKAIRDGYVDAIKAMTAGSGLITKIQIDQNKNLGIAVKNLGMVQSFSSGGIGGGATSSERFSVGGFVRNPNREYELYDTDNQAGKGVGQSIINQNNRIREQIRRIKSGAASQVGANVAAASAVIASGESILPTGQSLGQVTSNNILTQQLNTQSTMVSVLKNIYNAIANGRNSNIPFMDASGNGEFASGSSIRPNY